MGECACQQLLLQQQQSAIASTTSTGVQEQERAALSMYKVGNKQPAVINRIAEAHSAAMNNVQTIA